jgi:hypothetical protein
VISSQIQRVFPDPQLLFGIDFSKAAGKHHHSNCSSYPGGTKGTISGFTLNNDFICYIADATTFLVNCQDGPLLMCCSLSSAVGSEALTQKMQEMKEKTAVSSQGKRQTDRLDK